MGFSAAQYVGENSHLRVTRPSGCPHCMSVNTLEALGYYSRNLTGARATVVRIFIRRFRCQVCGRTVSILPSFAQPYRLIQNSTIDRYFSDTAPTDALWWQPLLEEYWKKFTRWIPELDGAVGFRLPRSPPFSDGDGWWGVLAATFGDLEQTTLKMVSRHGLTLFGRYKCHSASAFLSGRD